MEGYIVSLIIFTAIFALFGLGLNLQWGYTGLINFGHVAFMAIGGYVTVLLSDLDVPIPLVIWIPFCVLIGSLFAALLGLLIGLSTVRLREDYLAIVTIGVSEMVRLVALNEEWLTRGSFGVQGFPLPLQGFAPTLLTRVGMLAIFTGVIALGYWQMWKWLSQRLKGISRQSIVNSSLAVAGYLGSLGLLLYGTVISARQLKLAEDVSPWLLGLFLLGALVAIVLLYNWLARQTIPRLPDWSAGLALISCLLSLAVGLWIYQFAAHAIYTYSRTSIKTGLMFISVLVLALIFWGLQRLVRSPWGRVLKAIREDEEVAKALGKNVFWYKLQALMLGGLVAGVAGALYAWQLTTVYPDNFQPLVTFNAWTIVVLGGAGNNVGTLLGAAIFWAYQTTTRFILADIVPLDDARLGAFRVMIIGFLLMVLMVWRPQGILGKKEELTLGR